MAFYPGTSGNDSDPGTAGDDLYLVSAGTDVYDAAGGFDTFDFSASTSALNVFWSTPNSTDIFFNHASGNTTLTNFEQIVLSDFDDTFFTSSGTTYANDLTIDGGMGNDVFRSGLGNDTLIGGDGDDSMWGLAGVDTYDGGIGMDRVSFFHFNQSTEAVHADLRDQTVYNDGHGNVESMTSIESLGAGSVYGNLFEGNDEDNLLVAIGFNTTINGRGGDDLIQSDAGGDLDGGSGIDFLTLNGTSTFTPDTNSDGFWDEAFATDVLELNMATGQIVNDGFGNTGTASNFENLSIISDIGAVITGTDGKNEISFFTNTSAGSNIDAGLGADIVNGSTGIDTIAGNDGNDKLYGNDGDDIMSGGDGLDFLYGGDGMDQLMGDDGNDRLYGELGNDEIWGGFGADLIFGNDGEDTISGGGDNDTIWSGNDKDFVNGNGGNDFINAGDGDDRIAGNAGDDDLRGSLGNDLIYGNAGMDSIRGGGGNDIIFFDADDILIDGAGGYDRAKVSAGSNAVTLDMTASSIEMITGATNGNDVFDATGKSSFVRVFADGGNDTLIGGTAGDRFYGEGGDDTLTGNGGNDRFYFGSGGGDDTITDYTDESDLIYFHTDVATSIADLTITDDGIDTTITHSAGTITLEGVASSAVLEFTDFRFTGGNFNDSFDGVLDSDLAILFGMNETGVELGSGVTAMEASDSFNFASADIYERPYLFDDWSAPTSDLSAEEINLANTAATIETFGLASLDSNSYFDANEFGLWDMF